MSKITALKPGITLIENDGAWNSPDDIDIDLYTFGIDYMHYFSEIDEGNMTNQLNKQSFPGGFHVAIPLAEFDEVIPVLGFLEENTSDMANLVKEFFVKHRRVTNNLLYLITKVNDNPTGDYRKYGDPRDVMQPYAPGYLSNLNVRMDMNKRLFEVRGTFEVAWVI